MKLITRDTDYALRALCYFAKNKERVLSVPQLLSALKMPRPFFRKILQVLNKNRILKSYKGQGGGFQLAVKPEKIFLADLIRIFQGEFSINECLFKKKACPNTKTCCLRKRMNKIEKHVARELESISIASLLN